jgi:alcohol dehydrogenase class IV
MNFEFATAHRIIFGPGSLNEAVPAAVQTASLHGSKAVLIVSSRPPQVVRRLYDQLQHAGLEPLGFGFNGEPTLAVIENGVKFVRQNRIAAIIGFGGGSSIDAAKAIAALATNPGELLDYLEVIGRGKPLTRQPLPCIAIPTTAGTGAEVTRNAVLFSPEHRVKVSLRSPMMLPNVAIVDPVLTYDLPPAVTASTGLDALTQLIEAYVCTQSNPMTDGFCAGGLQRAIEALPRAYCDGHDCEAREDMCIASLFGGLALANAGLGAVHGFAGPLGGMFSAPHGAVCAALLPHVMAANIRALRQRQPRSRALGRYDLVAQMITQQDHATTDAAIAHIHQLCTDLAIPPLRTYGMTQADIPALVEKAQAASSMKANPIVLTTEELSEVLSNAI